MNYPLYKIICLGAIIGFTLLVVLLLVDRSRVTSIDSESYARAMDNKIIKQYEAL